MIALPERQTYSTSEFIFRFLPFLVKALHPNLWLLQLFLQALRLNFKALQLYLQALRHNLNIQFLDVRTPLFLL